MRPCLYRKIRQKTFNSNVKGIPLEYFEWERVVVDEIHECLCTSKDELKEAKAKNDSNSGFFEEKNRRAGREVSAWRIMSTPKYIIFQHY